MSNGYKLQKAIEQLLQDNKHSLTLQETTTALSRVTVEILCRCTKSGEARRDAYGDLLRKLAYDIANMELTYGMPPL